MAQMNIDLDKLGKIGQGDLTDSKTLKKIVQYLYQLSEQLKYWQYNLEEENLSEEVQEKINKTESGGEVWTATTIVNDVGITVKEMNQTVTLTIGEDGDLTGGKAALSDLTVNGKDMGTVIRALLNKRIIVSELQPAARGVIWLEPQTAGAGRASEVFYTGNGGSLPCNGTDPNPVSFLMAREGSEPAVGSTCSYGIRFRAEWLDGYGRVESIRVDLTGTNSNGVNQTVTVINSSADEYVGMYGYIMVDTLDSPGGALANVTFGASMYMQVTLTFSRDGQRQFAPEVFTVRAVGDTSVAQEVRTCNVHYIS